jgi:hypothetical protein
VCNVTGWGSAPPPISYAVRAVFCNSCKFIPAIVVFGRANVKVVMLQPTCSQAYGCGSFFLFLPLQISASTMVMLQEILQNRLSVFVL